VIITDAAGRGQSSINDQRCLNEWQEACYPSGLFRAVARFFDGPAYHRDLLQDDCRQVIEWWEKRRFFYNKILAGVGTVTCVLMISCGLIAEPLVGEAIGIPDPPILVPMGIIAYGIIANVCYTGGWIAELLLARFRPGASTTAFGVRAFRLGVKFSIGLTLFPAVLSWAVFLFSLATGRRVGPTGQ
jgi:hypothetical protein